MSSDMKCVLCQPLLLLVYLSYLKFCFQSTQMCDNKDDGSEVKKQTHFPCEVIVYHLSHITIVCKFKINHYSG